MGTVWVAVSASGTGFTVVNDSSRFVFLFIWRDTVEDACEHAFFLNVFPLNNKYNFVEQGICHVSLSGGARYEISTLATRRRRNQRQYFPPPPFFG